MSEPRTPNPEAVRRIVAHLWGEDFINLRAAVESFANGWTVVPKAAQSADGLRAALDNLLRHHNAGSVHQAGHDPAWCEFAQQARAALSAEPPATALDVEPER